MRIAKPMYGTRYKTMENLVLDVINQIEKDLENKDLAPLYELLSLLPKEALENYKKEAEEYDYLQLDNR